MAEKKVHNRYDDVYDIASNHTSRKSNNVEHVRLAVHLQKSSKGTQHGEDDDGDGLMNDIAPYG